jgi:hypothetical protein
MPIANSTSGLIRSRTWFEIGVEEGHNNGGGGIPSSFFARRHAPAAIVTDNAVGIAATAGAKTNCQRGDDGVAA